MNASPMRKQVLMTPKAIDGTFDQLEVDARTTLNTEDIYRYRQIIITGCGDSLFAAKSVELAMMAHSGMDVCVRPSLEVSRYLVQATRQKNRENTLVICISNSGEAARVVEAARIQTAAGATTLALTANPEGRLGKSTHHVLRMKLPSLPSAPGYAGFTATQFALILLAVRIGEVRMDITMDYAQELRSKLKHGLLDLESSLAVSMPRFGEAIDKLAGASLIEVVGPNLGVSEYGAAKFLEATGRHAVARDVEEWTHLNYFDKDPGEVATCLISPLGTASQSRIDEIEAFMTKLGRKLVRIGPKHEIPVHQVHNELWSPLFTSAPLALLAADLAAADGAEYGRGATGKWEDCADASTVQASKILDVTE